MKDKVVIITGSSRGIGLAIAKECARREAKVVLNAATDSEDLQKSANAIEKSGGEAYCITADVTKTEDVNRLISDTISKFGSIDALVNNAGIVADRSLAKMSEEEWDRVLEVNLRSVFLCCRAVIPHMTEKGIGRIINISSVIGHSGAFGQANYAAAKAGILGLTKSLALELAKYKITVNAICPGFIKTSMTDGIPDKAMNAIRDSIPLRRLGNPEEIAPIVPFLIEHGSYITGEAINVNGGFRMA